MISLGWNAPARWRFLPTRGNANLVSAGASAFQKSSTLHNRSSKLIAETACFGLATGKDTLSLRRW